MNKLILAGAGLLGLYLIGRTSTATSTGTVSTTSLASSTITPLIVSTENKQITAPIVPSVDYKGSKSYTAEQFIQKYTDAGDTIHATANPTEFRVDLVGGGTKTVFKRPASEEEHHAARRANLADIKALYGVSVQSQKEIYRR